LDAIPDELFTDLCRDIAANWAVSRWDRGPEGGDEAGIAVKKPKSPTLDSGSAAASLDEESERP